jgi:hypothetical protein
MTYVPQKVRECERQDCKYEVLSTVATLVYYVPVYDKHGNNLNPDKNRTSVKYRCYTCGDIWAE